MKKLDKSLSIIKILFGGIPSLGQSLFKMFCLVWLLRMSYRIVLPSCCPIYFNQPQGPATIHCVSNSNHPQASAINALCILCQLWLIEHGFLEYISDGIDGNAMHHSPQYVHWAGLSARLSSMPFQSHINLSRL